VCSWPGVPVPTDLVRELARTVDDTELATKLQTAVVRDVSFVTLDGVRLFLALIYSALTPAAALAFALGMSAQGRGLRPFKRPWLLSTLLGVQTVRGVPPHLVAATL
jgi:hypothetical protein